MMRSAAYDYYAPGEYLILSYVEPYKLSQRELADRLYPATVSRLLSQKAEVTPEMAVRLELVFGQSAEAWLAMQVAHSLAQAQSRG
jgi:addiction module HigA family antidote